MSDARCQHGRNARLCPTCEALAALAASQAEVSALSKARDHWQRKARKANDEAFALKVDVEHWKQEHEACHVTLEAATARSDTAAASLERARGLLTEVTDVLTGIVLKAEALFPAPRARAAILKARAFLADATPAATPGTEE